MFDEHPRRGSRPAPHDDRASISRRCSSATRVALAGLLAFGALNAFGGGYYGLVGAEGIPTKWLEGSPFEDYFVPSLVLLVAVGGSWLLAAIAVGAGWRFAPIFALVAGVIVLGWIAVQVAIIGYVSWMQPTTAMAGIVVLVLGRLLWAHKPIPSARPLA